MLSFGCPDSAPPPSGGMELVATKQSQKEEEVPKDLMAVPKAPEKLLFMLSSFDRGERMANWEGKDKMDIILTVVDLARKLCETGYDVVFYMISAWPASESRELVESHLQCHRTGQPVPIHFWDHYNKSIQGKLAYQHRYLVQQELDNFDFFLSIEDDMDLGVEQVQAYRHHCELLKTSIGERSRYYLPGFVRYEYNHHWANRSKCLWEGVPEDFKVQKLGDVWYAKTSSFTNQAMWMATREQVKTFNLTCNEPLFPPRGPGWVEYWSGGLQLYEQCRMRKVMPLDDFDLFTLWHMSDNKVGHRGDGITPIANVKTRLSALVEECIRFDVTDSNLLPTKQEEMKKENGASATQR